MSGKKPDFELPQSSLLAKIPEFLALTKKQEDIQMQILIKDLDEVQVQEQELDCNQICKIDVVAGLFELRKKDQEGDNEEEQDE